MNPTRTKRIVCPLCHGDPAAFQQSGPTELCPKCGGTGKVRAGDRQ